MERAREPSATSLYDLVDYPSRPYAATHPHRQATLGRLYGVATADPRRCRMLEIGCSDGGNLGAIAVGLPESSFVGVDAAVTAIEEGRALASTAGIGNLQLLCADLQQLGPELGEFDFIVAHGVYSWVPEPVRRKLLEICRARLAPSGVAYVSYNAQPGGHLRRPARDLMRFHVQGETEPAVAIESALDALASTVSAVPQGSPYRHLLEHELSVLARAGTSFVFHDVLAPENEPLYFEDFNARAEAANLRYLCESRFFESYEGAERSGLAELVPSAMRGDRLRAEQCLDFLKGRTFRQTLLVRAEVPIDCAIDSSRLHPLYFSAQVAAARNESGLGADGVERFVVPGGNRIATDNAVAKAALAALGQAWPRELGFAELCATVVASGAGSARLEADLAKVLLGLYAGDVIEFRTAPYRFASVPGERPLASPFARAQATASDAVTNLRHARVPLDERLRSLLQLVDGTRTHAELEALLAWPAQRIEAGLNELGRLGLLLA